MTLTDYPGHLVAVGLALAAAVVVFVIFRAEPLQAPERTKYRRLLAALQYAGLLSLLVILWDPCVRRTKPVFDRNTVLMLFDTSESMSVADDGRLPRLDKALDKFDKCFHSQGAGPRYRTYGFDDHPYSCGAPDLLRRWGSASNLHEAFSLIADSGARQTEGAPNGAPTGVVVFTDGQAVDKDPRRYLPPQRKDLPILLVGVGARRPHPDIAVKSILAPAGTPAEMPFAITAAITAAGALNEPVMLELLCDDTVVASRQLAPQQFRSPGAGPQEATIVFTVPAQGLGARVLTARVKAVKGEINLANNSRSSVVEVAPPRALEVLLYSQWASFDIGKIRQALAWDKRIHLSLGFDVVKEFGQPRGHAYASAGMAPLPETKEEFHQYDVIILGPCELDGLTSTQREGLYEFVAERGGGLLLLPGQTINSLTAGRTGKTDALLPVIFDQQTPPRLWPPRPDVMALTFEAQVGHIFDPNAFTNPVPPISPYYQVADVKPAATTLATVGDVPIITAQRLGRGRVCLLNASKLFTLYRADRQGGLLRELLCGLVAYLGRTPAPGAGVELFVERTADDLRQVAFNAYVVDKAFQPVTGANVLVTTRDQTVSMEPTGRGYYRTTLDWGLAQAVVATAQAEFNGSLLGERTIATSLPPVRDEMSCIDLDEPFLRALAQRTGGRYLHLDEISRETARLFVPRHQVGVTETVSSLWPKWPVLIALCLLLSAGWFIRRAIGLV